MSRQWFVSVEAKGHNPDIFIEETGYGTIAEITGGTLPHRMDRAKLIAAAPDLLAALELCLDRLEREGTGAKETWHAIDTARDVISRAKGEQS